MRRLKPLLAIIGLFLAVSACTGSTPTANPPTGGISPSASSPSSSSSPSPTAIPALITSFPSGCAGGAAAGADTVAFVASGRVWAVAPDGTGLRCLFTVSDPGPFAWGPRGDRVALAGLQVRGVGSDAARSASDIAPTYLSWGRPTGIAIVFSDGSRLEKAFVGSKRVDEITPLPDLTYRDVAYHPSGLAVAFVADGQEGSAIYISSNTGSDAKRLVWSKIGTVFGSLAFDQGGDQLFFSAAHHGGARVISRVLLKEGRVEEGLWKGTSDVLRLVLAPAAGPPVSLGTDPPSAAALDIGTGCADRQAVLSRLNGAPASPLLPGSTNPTTAIGWLDSTHVLVAEGACDGPYDLWVTAGVGTAPVLLASGVDRGAVRAAEPAQPPPLPDLGISSEFA